MTNRKNIKVGEDLFERMKADKGPHKSWPQYFEDQLSGDSGGVDTERLDRIEAAAREAASSAQSAERAVDELSGGRH